MTHRVLVTGAAGYLGSGLVESLAQRAGRSGDPACIVASDLREVPPERRLPGVEYSALDVRDPQLREVLARHAIDTVVHLAAIVTPGPKSNRAFEYSVDVLGTRNVLEACVASGVRRIVVTSSGAAYGYHADSPAWLTEDDPVRGNEAFAYSYHKRLVEEMLAEYRRTQPALEQVVLRVGTILGETTRNQITALFERPRLLAIKGVREPVRVHLGPRRGGRDRARDLRRTRRASTTWPATVRSASRRSRHGSASAASPCPQACCAPCSPCCTRSACRATARSRWISCATVRCSTTGA